MRVVATEKFLPRTVLRLLVFLNVPPEGVYRIRWYFREGGAINKYMDDLVDPCVLPGDEFEITWEE